MFAGVLARIAAGLLLIIALVSASFAAPANAHDSDDERGRPNPQGAALQDEQADEQAEENGEGEELTVEELAQREGEEPDTAVDGEAEDSIPASSLVELPGDCENGFAVIDPGVSVDCVFRLLPDVEADDIEFASISDGGDIFVPCRTSGRVVRCLNVGGDFIAGPRTLSLTIDDEFHETAASIDSQWTDAGQIYVSLPTVEPVTFDGLPIEVFSYPSGPVDGLFLNVRVRGSSRVIESIPIDVGTPSVSGQTELEFDLAPGRYRMWPCVGATPTTCEELPGGNGFQVVDPVVEELIAGHNRRSAERINVLFVGSGLGGDRDEVAVIAREMLGLDGPAPVSIDGTRALEPADVIDVRFGPMAIEPLASNANKFNFWYLEADLGSELSLVFDASRGDVLDVFGLPNLHVTALYASDFSGVSDARGTSFFGRQTVPPTEQIRFGGTRVSVSPEAPLYSAQTLAHEWGHALFELRDEYYGFDGRPVSLGYPNCAADESVGRTWWASHLGEVDPFVDEVIAAREAFGLADDAYFAPLADLVRIEPNLGGCYGNAGEPTAFRPSRDSLMNSEVPVFGSVHRARVEVVLQRFSGEGPLSSLDDLTIACEGRELDFTCTGVVATFVHPPEDTFLVGGSRCEFAVDPAAMEASDDGLIRHRVNCEGTLEPVEVDEADPNGAESDGVDPDGADSDAEGSPDPNAPETISILLGTVVDTIPLRQLPPEPEPEPAGAPISTTVPPGDESASDDSPSTTGLASDDTLAGGDSGRSGLIALGVGGGVLLAGLVLAVGLSIRKRRAGEQSR